MADPLSARTTRRTALKGLGIGGATALGLGERALPVRAELLRGPSAPTTNRSDVAASMPSTSAPRSAPRPA